VRRANSRGALSERVEQDPPDYFLSLKQQAFNAIAEARNRVRNKMGFYTPEQVKETRSFLHLLGKEARSIRGHRGVNARLIEYVLQGDFNLFKQAAFLAIDEARSRIINQSQRDTSPDVEDAKGFLRTLRNEARSIGTPLGDKVRPRENQKMLRVFCKLSKGKSLKQIAIEEKGPDNYEREMRALSVLTKRFSERVYKAVHPRCGLDEKGQIPAGFLCYKKSWNYLSSYFASIRRWPGVLSNCEEHGYALCEAFETPQTRES